MDKKVEDRIRKEWEKAGYDFDEALKQYKRIYERELQKKREGNSK